MRRTFLFSGAAIFTLACGSGGMEVGGGVGGATITGAGGGSTVTSSVVSSVVTASSTAASSSTGGSAGTGAPYPIVFAHGFFGFEKFAGLDFETYFYGLKDYFAQKGITVYTPAVDPFNDSTTRGAELEIAIEGVLAETGAAKVNIIGHSQGGLDARVVAHDHPEHVASVVTVATPHHGTPVADIATKLVSDPNAQAVIDQLADVIGAPIWDQVGQSSSVFKALYLFSQPGITAFNMQYPDDAGVYYASIAGRTGLLGDGADCAPDSPQPYITKYDSVLDPVDPLLGLTESILQSGFEGVANDGLVRARDAVWGEFWGCVPADHLDEVGQILGDDPGLGNSYDDKAMYFGIVSALRLKGF